METVTVWIGWRKLNGNRSRWERVCSAPTESEAFKKLLQAMDGIKSGSWSTIVLPEGEKP